MDRYVSQRRSALHALTALCAALTAAFVTVDAQASSHREAPFITEHPKVDNTDVYAFMSYAPERLNSGYVTLITNFQPLQAPYGGPNYFKMHPKALYELHIDNNGDAKEDITFQFRFTNNFKGAPLNIGGVSVPIALTQFGPVSDPNGANLNVNEKYTVTVVRGDRRTGAAAPVTMAGTGATVFDKPSDNIGDKTIPDYKAYADKHIYDVNIPGCNMPAKLFVGQRKEGFVVNLGRIFDLVNAPVGIITNRAFRGAEPNIIDDANITTLALEVHKSCLTAGDDPVVGVWSSASLPQTQLLNPVPPKGHETTASYGGNFVQVSRLGNPLVNEVVIGLPDKDRFNGSHPSGDLQFASYVTNPTIPELISVALNLDNNNQLGPLAPTNFPRKDLVTTFLRGIKLANGFSLNRPANLTAFSDQLRLNTAIAPVARENQHVLGVLGTLRDGGNDFAGFPNGRRPGDDVIDIVVSAGMGALCFFNANDGLGLDAGLDFLGTSTCRPSSVPLGATSAELHDAAAQEAAPFLPGFPYLFTPIPGATRIQPAAAAPAPSASKKAPAKR